MQSHLADAELARLEALFDCRVLDTSPEELFYQTARHASYLCGTPIALIGFIDAARVWFKSGVGWEYPEIPRQDSICEHTIRQSDLLVISDAATDHRFRNGPIVTHAGIRFYAGAPLLTNEGYAVGTLCVMDFLPRELPAGHKESLITLAQLLAAQLEMRRSTARISAASEHKRTEDALRRSQDRLLGIISSAMDAIITVDDNQRIVVFNKAAEQIFRCPAEQALSQPLDKFIPLRFREAHRQHIRTFGDTGVSSRSMYSPGTLMGVRADGEEFPVEATISQVKTASETLYSVILRDISVRRRTEDELRQAQKMEAVGHLAGGIAHEFNNYLGIIMGYSDLMAEEEVENESLRLGLTEIKGATQKASSLTRQLLAFSRKQIIEPTVLDLNASVWEAHKLLRRLIPANVDVIPVLHPDVGKVKVDPAQIQQILINLVVNARDAMPQGGKICIETANVELDEEYAGRHIEVRPGRYVMLAVSDNGSGIDEQTQARIFEPFFTTKQKGKGTGLGLSTVYGIVRQSGGHITVESALREGSRFRIYLPPTAVTELKVEDETPSLETEILSGTETVLVVEDEPALRRLISVSLEKRGYTVLAAEDGTEAIRILENNPGEIDLVVSDIMMPKLNGLELRKKATLLRPDMRFLFISGYAEDTIGRTTHLPQDAGYLEKPFLPIELARKVRALLNETDVERGSTGKTA